MITLKNYTSTPAPANFSFLYHKLARKQRYTAKQDEKPLVQQKITLKEAGGFESGKIFWKILFPERQKWGNSTENQFLHCSAPEFAWKTEIYVDSQ